MIFFIVCSCGRYCYDYGGGYERGGPGGRGGYGDDRSRGRYMNRQSGRCGNILWSRL